MGRFSGKSSAAAKAKRDLIRINPYEIPEIALSVIANICSKNNTDDASGIIGSLREELSKPDKDGLNFYDFVEDNRKEFYDFDFLHKVRSTLNEIVTDLLAHENTNDTQVVVAGGFSAGKSSFLNKLTGAGDLLPTGIDPVSMVSTYLYCSTNTKDIIVKGINLKDAVVLLDQDVLQSIQHESKSKVYLASVLNKLFVELPSDKLDGFVFIDTPGYNNSDKKNDTNNRSDRETALEAIGSGNVLLWIVDAGAGTVPAKDLEVINHFLDEGEDRRVAVIFNKADKKGEAEIKKIVNEAYRSLGKYGDAIIDVLGYSSQDGQIYYSANSFNMSQLLLELRRSGTGNSGVERMIHNLLALFEEEIDFAQMAVDGYSQERKKLLDEKNDAYKYLQSEKDGSKHYIESLSELLVDGYDTLKDRLDSVFDLASRNLDVWIESLNEIESTNNSNWQTKENINDLVQRYSRRHTNAITSYNKLVKYSYWTTEYRKEWVEKFSVQLNRVDDHINERYEGLEADIAKVDACIRKHREIAQRMNSYRDMVKYTLDTCVKAFRMSAHKVQDARVDFAQDNDVFSAIRTRNFSKFINSFVHGVKLSETNPEGYTPLTFAAKNGAYDMVNFLIEKGADLRSMDTRGYNPLHTAIQFGQTHVVDLILKADPSMAKTVSQKGETAQDLLKNTSINEIISKKL